MFSTVWEREENPGRKFSLSGPQISSPQIRRKSLSGKLMKSTFTQMPSCSQRSQQLSKEERRQFSNHQLSITQLSPTQPKNNSKSAQNNLKSTQNKTQYPQKINSKSNPYVSIIFIFIIIIIIFSRPCCFRTVKKKKMQRLEG